MPNSLRGRVRALAFSLFPAYFGTGARITYASADWREVRVKLPLSWRSRNYVGTIFGGSMYGAVDPIYMVMLIKNLGAEYTVWDKSATIRFRRPGKSTLTAHFALDAAELDTIRELTASGAPIDRVYSVDLLDRQGKICATIEKTIYIRRRAAEKPTRERSNPQPAAVTP